MSMAGEDKADAPGDTDGAAWGKVTRCSAEAGEGPGPCCWEICGSRAERLEGTQVVLCRSGLIVLRVPGAACWAGDQSSHRGPLWDRAAVLRIP